MLIVETVDGRIESSGIVTLAVWETLAKVEVSSPSSTEEEEDEAKKTDANCVWGAA